MSDTDAPKDAPPPQPNGSESPRPPLKLHQPNSLFPEPTPEEVKMAEEQLTVVNEWRKSKGLKPFVDVLGVTEEMMKGLPGMPPGAIPIPIGLGATGVNPFPMMGEQKEFLRPFRQPLYDSEFIVPGMRTNRILLYTRPAGMDFIHNVQGRVKGIYDTNLNQSSMLDFPVEFSATGFNLFLEDGASESDRAEITRDGLMSFIYSGRRVYANIPLVRMPRMNKTNIIDVFRAFIEETGLMKPNPKRLADEEYNKWKERLGNASPKLTEMYDFTIVDPVAPGRPIKAMKIKPGEAFAMEFAWPTPPRVSRPIKLTSFIEGSLWAPI